MKLTEEYIKKILPARPDNSNKGTFGRALVAAGSRNMPGAAVIAVRGAVLSGAGLVELFYPDCADNAVKAQLTENIFSPSASENGAFCRSSLRDFEKSAALCSAAAVGCGISVTPGSREFVSGALSAVKKPLVLDADALNIIAKDRTLFSVYEGDALLVTPHPGEMARLTGKSIAEINSSREKTALDFASSTGCFVLLKGSSTVIASPRGDVFVNTTGCSALARGGSGDMLTGMITAFLAQGLPPADALCAAAYIHGLAGDIAAERFSPFASSVENILTCIPEAFLSVLKGDNS